MGIILLAISLCTVFSRALFTTYKNEQVMTMDGNIYLLQYGTYINKEVMEENVKKLEDYLTYEEDGKYYVFIGASTFLENANILSKLFENNGVYTYIKNDYIGNTEIINKILKLDKKMQEESDSNKIYEINKKILNILKSI